MSAHFSSAGYSNLHSQTRDPEVQPESGPQRYSRFAGGLQWHVKHQGSGTGRKALLLHGTGSSIHSWNGMFPLLAEQFELLAPDLPGHGDTLGGSDNDLTLGGMSFGVRRLLEELEFDPELVIGHSAGAAIALKLCCEGACRPRHVVGINAALLPYGGRLAPAVRPVARLFASLPGLPGLVAARAKKPGAVERLIFGSGSKLGKEEISRYRHLFSSRRHVASTLTMMANWRLEGLLDEFDSTGIPLTLVVADNDQMVEPWQANRIAEKVKLARQVSLSGLGHLAHEEDPATVARTIIGLSNEACQS